MIEGTISVIQDEYGSENMKGKKPQYIKSILVTGATGYVGGRLVPRLLDSGYRVRTLARSMRKLSSRSWARHPMVELAKGDLLDPASLQEACNGCKAVYYLVHSMNPFTKDFESADQKAARNMVMAAHKAGVERIFYLGGLTPVNQRLSRHLMSRAEVGRILQSGPVPTTVLRAAMILGSGSASFEILRYLVERLPVMITPKWVRNEVQPISIRNVLGYLVGCLEHNETIRDVFDIGGPEIVTYERLFQIYAEEANLPKRTIFHVPFLTPRLSSYWIHLVTPVHSSIARPLAEGLQNRVVCEDNRIQTIIPQRLMTCRQTIQRILEKKQQQLIETSWTDAGLVLPPEWVQRGDAKYAGGSVFTFAYVMRLKARPEAVWHLLIRIGGEQGWYFADYLWNLRGKLDKLFGGVGAMRGRRHASNLQIGDALDFWRVIDVREKNRLILMSEMKAPGEAVLDFRLQSDISDLTNVQLISRFLPRGLWGLIYWYILLPFHAWLFKGLLKSLAAQLAPQVMMGPVRFDPHQEPTREGKGNS